MTVLDGTAVNAPNSLYGPSVLPGRANAQAPWGSGPIKAGRARSGQPVRQITDGLLRTGWRLQGNP
jgi:hypothetical protein